LLQRLTHLGRDGGKGGRLLAGDVGQDLAVHGDAGEFSPWMNWL
jgi:hypothetical protein